MNPAYPIYIISKGRWESRFTAKALDFANTPYRIVIEPQEYDQYSAVIDPSKILTLPFSNLGQGSIPARNWVWDHAISEGHKRHWILDDNIRNFFRFTNNSYYKMTTGTPFKVAEDFVERYTNVPLAGLQYFMFAPRKEKNPPMLFNTRVYSCILIDNSLEFRWRGRYNEDTDLSLRTLKAGYCTILFQAFLAEKNATMRMKGGNTDELYKDDGRLKMAQSLQAQHPDVTQIKWKWGCWQHEVDYSGFKSNRLIKRPDYIPSNTPNEYGMKLVNGYE